MSAAHLRPMNWLALDIGGANIKAADGKGYAESYAFAMWRQPSRLAQQIRTVISEAPPCDHLAVTMTGELADCFESRPPVSASFCRRSATARTIATRGFSSWMAAWSRRRWHLAPPHLAAASNWLALARFVGRYVAHGPALLIDVGSTTCDVVPFVDGKPQVKGMNDTARLLASELVYTGVERSPLCAILHERPYRGRSCPWSRNCSPRTAMRTCCLVSSPKNLETRKLPMASPRRRLRSRPIGADVCRRSGRLQRRRCSGLGTSGRGSTDGAARDGDRANWQGACRAAAKGCPVGPWRVSRTPGFGEAASASAGRFARR